MNRIKSLPLKQIMFCTAVCLALASAASALPRLTIQGKAFIEAAGGKTIILRGVTITNNWWGLWSYPQSDSLAALGLNPMIRYTRTVGWFLDSIDYGNLQTLGGNVVRYEFSNELFEPANAARDSNLADVRQVIRRLAIQGKYTILSMNGAPGLDVQDQDIEDTIPAARRLKSVFESDSLERDWSGVWTWLAEKLAGDSAVAGFEILNEPRLPAAADISAAQCAAKYERLCRRIRIADPARLILIPEFNSREANPGETYYSATLGANTVDAGEQGVIKEKVWPLLPDSLVNIAMVFHWFEPSSFVHIGTGDFSAVTVTSDIQGKLSWPNTHGRPVFVTEYGANYSLTMAGMTDRRVAWHRTVHDVVGRNGVSSCAATFKGEISPYITPNTNFQFWVQYIAAADQIEAINGKPAFISAQESEAAARNGFDSLLVKYLWQNDAVVNRSCLGSGPVLDELHRYFGSTAVTPGNKEKITKAALADPFFAVLRNRVSLTLNRASDVRVTLYRLDGKLLSDVDMGDLSSGRHTVPFVNTAKECCIIRCMINGRRAIQDKIIFQ